MKKQNFKFLVQSAKFGNAKTINIKAHSVDEAIALLWEQKPKLFLTYTVLCQATDQSVNPITNFDFNYDSEFYKNYINTL